jgi:hypothetical protein
MRRSGLTLHARLGRRDKASWPSQVFTVRRPSEAFVSTLVFRTLRRRLDSAAQGGAPPSGASRSSWFIGRLQQIIPFRRLRIGSLLSCRSCLDSARLWSWPFSTGSLAASAPCSASRARRVFRGSSSKRAISKMCWVLVSMPRCPVTPSEVPYSTREQGSRSENYEGAAGCYSTLPSVILTDQMDQWHSNPPKPIAATWER